MAAPVDNKIPCAGIIVFNKSSNQTILVSTDRGNFSFPKGKRNKKETDIETAWRELEEETGLTKNNVTLFDSHHIDEFTKKGHVSVRYFIGILTKDIPKFKFDKSELTNVQWYDIDKVFKLDKLKDARKLVLQKALVHLNPDINLDMN